MAQRKSKIQVVLEMAERGKKILEAVDAMREHGGDAVSDLGMARLSETVGELYKRKRARPAKPAGRTSAAA